MRRRDEVLVGLFTTVAIIILALASIWLVRGGLNRGYLLHSRFAWGSGIKQGAPVWLVGVTVGAVDKVDLEHRVPMGSVATIVPNGFFGDMAIALTPPRPNPVAYEPGDTVPVGVTSAGLQAILQRADTLSTALSIMMGTLKAQFVDSGGIREMRRTAFALNKVLESFNQIAAVQSRELQQTLVALRSRVNAVDSVRIDSTMRSMQAAS
jgi:ABC-type transporter Mla subunit MlaD